ncbi:3-dehydro-L-gulonate 2-dehydrogenase [Membranihabitans maritimus]|uniref:3-dehydro-L-gulonate 2-dehydrogenase n=1 Tax=Membranihabitans maritimus TaxID=2904244 RepID=UPI001F00215E|nr:3-dehydro-L-gulonate 2-dehydrogenase [Membranihabitans maritimus]
MADIRIPFEKIYSTLYRILTISGFFHEKAKEIARIHTESSRDGIYSHGLNRFPLFIEYVQKGVVKMDVEPELVQSVGAIERWDGKYGSGVWNAMKSTDRAISIAKKEGIGLVALRNTNHWMRGGTYGWQAAEKGCIFIGFTNTIANMPPWGGTENRIGNNPMVIAMPRSPKHIVLDMSLSQFSFGKIESYKNDNQMLPFPGGWNEKGELTKNPEEIEKTMKGLPVGYWKGSALAIVLDMLATVLSNGYSTAKISSEPLETGLSQVFICVDPGRLNTSSIYESLLSEIENFVHHVPRDPESKATYYPGERTYKTRQENTQKGIPVNKEVWSRIQSMIT